MLEKLLDQISFEATAKGGDSAVIDAAYVDQQLGELVEDEDLSRCIS